MGMPQPQVTGLNPLSEPSNTQRNSRQQQSTSPNPENHQQSSIWIQSQTLEEIDNQLNPLPINSHGNRFLSPQHVNKITSKGMQLKMRIEVNPEILQEETRHGSHARVSRLTNHQDELFENSLIKEQMTQIKIKGDNVFQLQIAAKQFGSPKQRARMREVAEIGQQTQSSIRSQAQNEEQIYNIRGNESDQNSSKVTPYMPQQIYSSPQETPKKRTIAKIPSSNLGVPISSYQPLYNSNQLAHHLIEGGQLNLSFDKPSIAPWGSSTQYSKFSFDKRENTIQMNQHLQPTGGGQGSILRAELQRFPAKMDSAFDTHFQLNLQKRQELKLGAIKSPKVQAALHQAANTAKQSPRGGGFNQQLSPKLRRKFQVQLPTIENQRETQMTTPLSLGTQPRKTQIDFEDNDGRNITQNTSRKTQLEPRMASSNQQQESRSIAQAVCRSELRNAGGDRNSPDCTSSNEEPTSNIFNQNRLFNQQVINRILEKNEKIKSMEDQVNSSKFQAKRPSLMIPVLSETKEGKMQVSFEHQRKSPEKLQPVNLLSKKNDEKQRSQSIDPRKIGGITTVFNHSFKGQQQIPNDEDTFKQGSPQNQEAHYQTEQDSGGYAPLQLSVLPFMTGYNWFQKKGASYLREAAQTRFLGARHSSSVARNQKFANTGSNFFNNEVKQHNHSIFIKEWGISGQQSINRNGRRDSLLEPSTELQELSIQAMIQNTARYESSAKKLMIAAAGKSPRANIISTAQQIQKQDQPPPSPRTKSPPKNLDQIRPLPSKNSPPAIPSLFQVFQATSPNTQPQPAPGSKLRVISPRKTQLDQPSGGQVSPRYVRQASNNIYQKIAMKNHQKYEDAYTKLKKTGNISDASKTMFKESSTLQTTGIIQLQLADGSFKQKWNEYDQQKKTEELRKTAIAPLRMRISDLSQPFGIHGLGFKLSSPSPVK